MGVTASTTTVLVRNCLGMVGDILYIGIDNYKNYMEHYGVKGMRWGIRRYQPYKNGKKGVYIGDAKVGARSLHYNSGFGDTAKALGVQALKTAVATVVPGAGLVMNAKVAYDISKRMDLRDYSKKDGEIEKISNLRKKTSATTALSDAKETNPGKGAGRVNNCGYCTAAFELRRRGYDVEARRKASGISTNQYSDWFEDVEYRYSNEPKAPGESRKQWVVKNYDKLTKSIEQLPDGARGFCAFEYEGLGKGGHTISWEVQDGEVVFYDAQSGGTNVDKVLSFSDQNYVWGRLDDRKLKAQVTEACVSKKGR